MATLPTRTTASFDAIKPVSSLTFLDDEFNQYVGASGIFNGGTTGTKLLVKSSDAADPPLELDQVGAGPIAEWKQNGTLKVSVNNSGQIVSDVATGTAPIDVDSTTVCPNLNADTVDGIQGANIAKLDTNVAAWVAPWFYPIPPAATESIESTHVFVVPTGTAITVTKLRVIFRGGSHTAGTVLTFSIEKRNSSGGGSVSLGTVTINDSGPAVTAVGTTDIGDTALSDGDYLNCRLTTRTGSPTETLITVMALGTQKLT